MPPLLRQLWNHRTRPPGVVFDSRGRPVESDTGLLIPHTPRGHSQYSPGRRRTEEDDRGTVLCVLAQWDATGIVIADLVEECAYLSRLEAGAILKEVEHLLEYRDEYRPADALRSIGAAPRAS